MAYTLIKEGFLTAGDDGDIALRYPDMFLGKEYYVDHVEQRWLFGVGPTGGTCPEFKIQGSNDRQVWYDLPGNASYVRLTVIAQHGWGCAYWASVFGGDSIPGPAPAPAPAPAPEIPPAPTLTSCTIPSFSWNLYEMLKALISYLQCTLNNIIAQLEWIISVLVSLIPQLLAFLVYVLTLQWIADFLAKFFDQLDTWLSGKFGIDKDKPFFEELLKKVFAYFTGWLGALVDDDLQNTGRIK